MAPESSRAPDLPLPDEAATRALGAALARGIAPGRVLFLSGPLGAGKTTLARGLLRALGHAGTVRSPSYGLVELYELSSLNLYHFDFYRLNDPSEWQSSGFREHFNPQSACLVEWPERVPDLSALCDLDVALDIDPPGRRARLVARTPQGRAWADAARKPSSPR